MLQLTVVNLGRTVLFHQVCGKEAYLLLALHKVGAAINTYTSLLLCCGITAMGGLIDPSQGD